MTRVQPLFEHRLDVHEYGTRVLELEGSGPTLILLHGWGDSADTWRPLMARLGEVDRAAVAVDMPGFGTASRLGPGAMLPQLDAFAGELVERVAEESGGPVVVAGNSLGGVVALRLAERADLPLAGVVPISPAGLDMPKWFEIVDRDPVIRTILSLPVPIPPPVIERAVGEVYRRLAFSRPGLADPQVVAMFAAHHRDRERARRLLASGRRLLPELSSAKAFDFAKVRVPVLVIWGTLDRMVSHSGAERLRDALGGRDLLHVELLDEVGHCPQLEATDRVLDLLLGFPGAQHARAA
jgi:pimeloyl-ACP methyl ester carboxylesterase